MDASILKFSGRTEQLNELVKLWELASDLVNPIPQVVTIKAERGIGKTRLAWEFFKQLSKRSAEESETAYWPDELECISKNLKVNPTTTACKFHNEIPFLWWGLRAGDKSAENGVAGDAIATYDKDLAPHLVALLVRARMKNRALSLFHAWKSVGVDALSSHLGYDAVLSIGKGLLSTAQILTGAINDEALNNAIKKPISRADAVLSDLEAVFNPENKITFANTPGIIFIDDAQFAEDDAALPSFIENLIHKAITQQWPVLILATHWKAQLSPELVKSEQSFVGIIQHFLKAETSKNGPAVGHPGGCLNSSNYTEIDLSKIDDLKDALFEKLPGLTEEQSSTILKNTDGNPRFLEQVVEFSLENEDFFEEFDCKKTFTEHGFNEIIKETKNQDIFKVVMRRLRDAPEAVQEAVCMASLQGVRFANDLVEAIAKVQTGRPVLENLGKAEKPFSLLNGTNKNPDGKIGEFVERLFYQVAQRRRKSLTSLGGEKTLQDSFRKIIAEFVTSDELRTNTTVDTQKMAYEIAANLFESSTETSERGLAQKALGEVARLELDELSFEAACAAYERLLRIEKTSPVQLEYIIKTYEWLAAAYRMLNWPYKRSHVLKRLIMAVAHYVDDDLRILLNANDKDAVMENFEKWKQKPDAPEVVYLAMCEIIVRNLLELSELAHEWPNLNFREGDDTVSGFPFLFHLELQFDLAEYGKLRPDNVLDAFGLVARAYNYSPILKNSHVEYQHFKILNEGAEHYAKIGQYDWSVEKLSRAKEVAEKLDVADQIQVLANLGAIYGQKGDFGNSKKILEEAIDKVDEILVGNTFPVNVPKNGSGKVRHIDVPAVYSDEFDQNPEKVVYRIDKLVRTTADIQGNLGAGLQNQNMLVEAYEHYVEALKLHKRIGHGLHVIIDLKNLGDISSKLNKPSDATAYWSECIEVQRIILQRVQSKAEKQELEKSITELQECIARLSLN
jgi:tetratricopeptide (TPR) repeat protein